MEKAEKKATYVLCETTTVGDAGRGEELALVPRSALIGSNMADLKISHKPSQLISKIISHKPDQLNFPDSTEIGGILSY